MTDPTPSPNAPLPAAPLPAAPAPFVPPMSPLGSPGARPRGGGIPGVLVAVLVPILAVVMFAGGVFAERSGTLGTPPGSAAATATVTASPSADEAAELALIEQAWHDIQDNYVDPKSLDDQTLAYAAIRAMTDAVGDEGHTSFMTAADAKAVDQSLSGSFVGIGVQIIADKDGGVMISGIIPNTPAEAAGLKRGDHILAVDGKTTQGENLDTTVSRVRGPEGEGVTLTIGRAGVADFDVTVTRRKFDLPLVSWAMVPGTTIAMIRLEQFATGATDALKRAITAAKSKGATGIVFDLRANPGGYVNEAVGVASQFVADGIVFQSYDRSGEHKDADVTPGGLATEIPLVVLANGQTASSAEIVTGAIQDAGRGKVVGEKTFGTGTVLGRFDLADGSSLRIGVERWLTRSGRPIWHEGLEPDVKVALPIDVQPLLPDDLRTMSPAQFADSPDAQVRKAVELLSGGN